MRGLNPAIQPYAETLIAWAASVGFVPRVTSILRTYAQQSKLYNEYLAKLARGVPTLPAAPPGKSRHEYGLAWDMVCSTSEQLAYLGAIWNSWGGHWSASDPVHFEVR